MFLGFIIKYDVSLSKIKDVFFSEDLIKKMRPKLAVVAQLYDSSSNVFNKTIHWYFTFHNTQFHRILPRSPEMQRPIDFGKGTNN